MLRVVKGAALQASLAIFHRHSLSKQNNPNCCPAILRANSLISAAGIVLSAVGEEPVDDHSDDGEDEDDEAPKKLVGRRTIRLEDLDCGRLSQQ